MRISDWSSDVCSSDLLGRLRPRLPRLPQGPGRLARGTAEARCVACNVQRTPLDAGDNAAPLRQGMTADAVITRLGLAPHPEGGWYRETYRHAPADGGRGACTAIYFLLRAGEVSAWHRVKDADELWHWYARAPLALTIAPGEGAPETTEPGPDLDAENGRASWRGRGCQYV